MNNDLSMDEYMELAMRTKNKELSPSRELASAGLGLSGEAGEVADIIKKILYHKHSLDSEDIVSELGDVLWYVALICDSIGVSLSHVGRANIEKLTTRYPDGFSSEDSIARVDVIKEKRNNIE